MRGSRSPTAHVGNATDLPTPSAEDIERIYRSLRTIRRVEETIVDIYPSDKVRSPVHLSIGQEGVSVGVCDALEADDVVSATYRGHAAYLAKGGSLKAMAAELFGKADGAAGGRGGSMHLISVDKHVLGGSAVVGTTIPVALGYSLALKREGKGRVVACFFGDGATEEGVFYESLNFASLHSLPILFVCENNGYAIHQPLSRRWATQQLCQRIETFGVQTKKIDDGDVFAIRAATVSALAAMRGNDCRPAFMECATYRWREHVGPSEDFDAGYRSRNDASVWMANDPVKMFAGMLPAAIVRAIDAAIESKIEAAFRFADDSPFPQPDELGAHVYAD